MLQENKTEYVIDCSHSMCILQRPSSIVLDDFQGSSSSKEFGASRTFRAFGSIHYHTICFSKTSNIHLTFDTLVHLEKFTLLYIGHVSQSTLLSTPAPSGSLIPIMILNKAITSTNADTVAHGTMGYLGKKKVHILSLLHHAVPTFLQTA